MTLLPHSDPELPALAMLLIAYNQQRTIEAAIDGALAQDYPRLTIVVSDDASTDDTFAVMQRKLSGYAGPHRVVLNRNARNLGIGAHLSHAATLCPDAELLLVAAGDDVSLPQRCMRTAAAWLETGRRVDLIASALEDIDADGRVHAVITPSPLQDYRNLGDWLAAPPHVVGAAQAWTRRLLERFGPLPQGVVAEDLIMVFRAIGTGGAITLAEPLVRYRRGGLSGRVRALHARDVVARLLKNSRHSLVELPQLLADAQRLGQLQVVEAALTAQLERERFIHDVFTASTLRQRWQAVRQARRLRLSVRLRMAIYAMAPWLLAPWFWLKRRTAR